MVIKLFTNLKSYLSFHDLVNFIARIIFCQNCDYVCPSSHFKNLTIESRVVELITNNPLPSFVIIIMSYFL